MVYWIQIVEAKIFSQPINSIAAAILWLIALSSTIELVIASQRNFIQFFRHFHHLIEILF